MFTGIFSALLTPFDADGTVDEPGLRRLIDFQVSKGLQGIYICGNTGQGLLLSVDERRRVHELALEQAAGRLQVIAHVCALSTRDTVALVQDANERGLAGISSLAPVYVSYTQDEMVDFYRAISDHNGLPCLIYVKSGGGAAEMQVETAARIAQLPNIIGMKYTDTDLFRMQWIARSIGPHWNILSGPDEMFLPALAMGVHGCIGTTQNIIPEVFVGIRNAFLSGQWDLAMTLQTFVTRMVILYRIHGGLATAMAILKLRGVLDARTRAPLAPTASPEAFSAIEKEWRSMVSECPINLR